MKFLFTDDNLPCNRKGSPILQNSTQSFLRNQKLKFILFPKSPLRHHMTTPQDKNNPNCIMPTRLLYSQVQLTS